MGTSPALATTQLTVDLSSTIGPVTHAASGSCYGVTEKLPADVTALLAPLHPNMFTNPAAVGAGRQQSIGDAIVVAGRLAPVGGKVTVRLADWFPSWPYAFTNITDWFDKLAQTVSRKKASGVNNYYGYEIWNEPNGTWSNSMSFNDFWKQSYAKLRELDPGAKLIGPSISYYDSSYLKTFLSYAKSNDCVPDIVGWHELNGGNLTGNLQDYRALEKQLGIGPLAISINEYSGKDWLAVEGQPGASAPLIAKFERFRVESASITFWDVSHPGRLGSLLATDTATNGGWWFYKWYGDMSGTMVSTTPPSPNDPAALDGFANLDATGGKASVLFAGVNDGTVQVIVKGLKAAAFLGTKVHALVEHTPFASRSTVVTATDTVSSDDVNVTNDQIAVTVSRTNNSDGYRLVLAPAGSGTGDVDGGAFAIDAGVRDGSPTGSGGVGAGGSSGGGRGDASGFDARMDVASSGGVPGTGGITAGSVGGAGGGREVGLGGSAAGTGGAAGRIGAGGSSTTVSGRGGAAGSTSGTTPSGCACRIGANPSRSPLAPLLLAVVAGWLRSKRRRRSGRPVPDSNHREHRAHRDG